ncbi:hypothetical protein KAR91_02070 [Candidatus Pacearchaeota archaeon]|nr:hypothetical protein [Candidatus Pacearchaeota archaeon]
METQPEDRNYLKEAVVFIPLFLGAIAVFGIVCDKVLKSEEKAEAARKLGFDV